MAHKTLINGTAYNITGGKSLVSGTAYNISGGKTMVGGTTYGVSIGGDEYEIADTAVLYNTGDFV